MRDSLLAWITHLDFVFIFCIFDTLEVFFDYSFWSWKFSKRDGKIGLFEIFFFSKICCKFREALFVFCYHHYPRSIPIDTVYQRRLKSKTGEFFSEIILNLLYQRNFFTFMISRMDIDSCWFIHYQNISIFKYDICLWKFLDRRKFFWFFFFWLEFFEVFFFEINLDFFTDLKFIFVILFRLFSLFTDYFYFLLTIEFINETACCIWKELLEKFIKSLLGIIRSNRKFLHKKSKRNRFWHQVREYTEYNQNIWKKKKILYLLKYSEVESWTRSKLRNIYLERFCISIIFPNCINRWKLCRYRIWSHDSIF